MKKRVKILIAILTAAIMLSAVAVYSFATNSDDLSVNEMSMKEDDASGYKYEIFTPSSADSTSGTLKRYTSADKLAANLANAPSGSVVTLLSNVTISNVITAGSNKTIYLDLNGYNIIHSLSGRGKVAIRINPGVTLYVYSSDPNNTARSIVTSCDANKDQTLPASHFSLRYDNTNVYFGTVTNAPVVTPLSTEGGSVSATVSMTGSYDGKNIETYSSTLFTSYKTDKTSSDGATTLLEKNPENSSATFIGSTHYQVNAAEETPFLGVYSAPNLTAKDATFVSTTGNILLKTTYDGTLKEAWGGKIEPAYPCDSNIYMENCRFYTSGTAIFEAYESPESLPDNSVKKSEIVFNGCYFACGDLIEETEYSGSPTYTNCYFTPYELPEIDDYAITSLSDEYALKRLEFNYNSGILDSENPFVLKTGSDSIRYNSTTKTSKTCTITWVGINGTVITQKIDTELGFIPNHPTENEFLPKASGAYAYRYFPEIAPATEDATYTLLPTANFTLKANLTLYTDFVYNIYLPKEAGDSKNLNFVSLDGVKQSLSKTVTIDGKSYYILEKHISALNGDETFDFVANITAPTGTFEKTWTFSIPDYVERITNGSYTTDAKVMVDAAMTYIKAAINYRSNPDVYTITGLTHISGTKSPEVPSNVRDVFYGMNLSIDENINFRFYLYDDVSLDDNAVSITYPQSNVITTVTLTKNNLIPTEYTVNGRAISCYEFTMKAYDVRDEIAIRIGDPEKETPDYVYSLANYVHYVNDPNSAISNRDETATLMDALWAYSIASERYVKNATSDSPEVDLTINGAKINSIVANSEEEIAAANKLATEIFALTGKMPAIVSADDGDGNIIISVTAPTHDYDCTVEVKGCDLVITSAYKTLVKDAVGYFATEYIAPLTESFDFNDKFSKDYYTDRIYYSDFGVAGDGKTDDFSALLSAHNFANEAGRFTICADAGKSYYICNTMVNGSVQTINIMTNVDWQDANFTIDDSKLSVHKDSAKYSKYIFTVASSYKELTITDRDILNRVVENGLGEGTRVIDLELGYPALIVPYNSSHKIYRRLGYGSWDGESMHEIILIDENGKIDESTPLMFDYTSLNRVYVYRVDVEPITIEGGIFTTIASDIDCVVRTFDETDGKYYATGIKEAYFNRGLDVRRSHTMVKNVQHYVTGELSLERQKNGEIGAPYHGFFSSHNANDVTFDGCILSAKRCYNKKLVVKKDGTKFSGTMGTYGISSENVNNLTFLNCTQANFWVVTEDDANGNKVIVNSKENAPGAVTSMATNTYTNTRMFWGLGGTNYCKNMSYVNSTLSRFDAHQGLYNGKVIDSVVTTIALVGKGNMLIEGTRCIGESEDPANNAVFSLRSDYGSTWDGTITIKDVDVLVYATSADTTASFGVISSTYTNWYYGYECHFPNLLIDNLQFHNSYRYYNEGYGDSLLSADTQIPILAKHPKDAISLEPNLHLSKTSKTPPIYPDVDKDGDKYVDGTEILFDGTTSKSGVTDTSSFKNLNPIVPPQRIEIKNNPHGDYYFPTDKSTFFDNTWIIVDGVVISEGWKMRPSDSPLAEYN